MTRRAYIPDVVCSQQPTPRNAVRTCYERRALSQKTLVSFTDTKDSHVDSAEVSQNGGLRDTERLFRPLGEPYYLHMGDSVLDFI
jgi:hypothetical protein